MTSFLRLILDMSNINIVAKAEHPRDICSGDTPGLLLITSFVA
jgi:hypothetical protein